jgi:predicted phosphoribosyltransferase
MEALERTVSLPFANRHEAGRLLAERLRHLAPEHPLVLGIPRGGVPLAAAVAEALGAPLDIIVARKLGAPISPELAIGAVTADGGRFLNQDILAELAVDEQYLEAETARQLAEASRREQTLRGGRAPEEVRGRAVILCDDGLATGATMRAAVRSLRARGAGRIIVAVPVGSHEACAALAVEADQVVCLDQPEPFGAVGRFYLDFRPVEDSEVIRILSRTGAIS